MVEVLGGGMAAYVDLSADRELTGLPWPWYNRRTTTPVILALELLGPSCLS